MPEQANSVSSGLSPIIKTARPGWADLTASAKQVTGKGTGFSNDLDKARQQQLGKVHAEPAQRNSRKDGNAASATEVRHAPAGASLVRPSGSAEASRPISESPAIVTGERDVIGSPVPIEVDASGNPLLPENRQQLTAEVKQHHAGRNDLPTAPNTSTADHVLNPVTAQLREQHRTESAPVTPSAVLNPQASASSTEFPGGTVGEVAAKATLAGQASGLSTVVADNGVVAPPVLSAEEGLAGNTGRLSREQPLDITVRKTPMEPGAVMPHAAALASSASVSTPTPVSTEKTAVAALAPATAAAATTKELPTAPNRNTAGPELKPVIAQLREVPRTESTPVAPRAVLNLQASVKSAGVPSGTVGEFAAKATHAGQASGSNATVADDGVVAPSALLMEEGVDDNTGRLIKEQTLDVTLRKPPMEPGAVMTNAVTLSKGRLSVPGEVGGAVMKAPETLTTGQINNTSVSQTNAVKLTQLASANGIVTPATLAGRFRHLDHGMTAEGTKTPLTVSQTGLNKAVLPSLSAGGAERLSVAESPAPLVNDSLSGKSSLMELSDATQTVQQRIATTEAMLSQMAQEAGAVTVKMPAADNLVLGVSGSTVAAPLVQHSESTAGPITQAPLNINLTSADAENALAGNVKWMTNEGVKNAVMTVTPQGMGPISIKIGIDRDQMDVSIIASQHSTRDALEAMLPRLREQLAVQGHETVKVDVSDGKNEQARSGNGQTFAESRNPAGASPQDKQSNGSNHGEKKDYGRSDGSDAVAESFMAEDLQRVAARALGEAGSRPVFDAYV